MEGINGTSDSQRIRMALIYRYGVHDHKELYPIIPQVLKLLGEQCDVLYAGPNRWRVGPEYQFPGVHYLFVPFRVNRARSLDKVLKALLWYLWVPFLGLYFRWFWRADAIWIDESSLPAQSWLLQLFSGRPVVATVTDFFLDIYGEKFSLLRPLIRMFNTLDLRSWRRAAGLFTRTDSLRQWLIAKGASPDRAVTTHDAVRPDLFIPGEAPELRRRLGFEPEDVVVCHHGILHPNKGIPRAIQWMVPTLKTDPHLKLLIVGGGPDYGIVQRLVRSHQLEKQVILTGWLPSHADVNAHLNASDIGLVMRVGQTMDHYHVTGALVHSMMSGLPVLACRLAGIQEIVEEGREGFLFDPQSPDEFLAKLARLRASRDLRHEMGCRGRNTALVQFDPDTIARQTVDALIRFARLGAPANSMAAKDPAC